MFHPRAPAIAQTPSIRTSQAHAARTERAHLYGRERMSRRRQFGTHHCHFQPRDATGAFISYQRAGRSLGREAVAARTHVVLTRDNLWVAAVRHTSVRQPAARLLYTVRNASHFQ